MMTPEVMVIRPQGRLDASRAPALEQELRDHLAAGRANLLVDLGETNYISSNGLRVLLAMHKATRQAQGSLRLCCLSPRLAEIFEMVGFDQVLDIFPDRNRAIQAFHAEEGN